MLLIKDVTPDELARLWLQKLALVEQDGEYHLSTLIKVAKEVLDELRVRPNTCYPTSPETETFLLHSASPDGSR